VLQAEDVAVTALQTLDLLSELPAAAAPIELVASDFRPTAAGLATTIAAQPGVEGLWLRGGIRGVQALAIIDLPEPGLYTLSSFGVGDGPQGWLIDACQKAILCPTPEAAAGPGWRPVLSAPFAAGRHSLLLTLPPGAAVGRVRLERKKDTSADYMATLARLGFDVGPSGPIARGRAVEAQHFLRDRRARLVAPTCGDVLPPGQTETALAEPFAPAVPGGAAFTGQPPSGEGVPLPAPAVAPPTTGPVVSASPEPPATPAPDATPAPRKPAPTPTPEPAPTVAPQPPGSPVIVATPAPPGA
jgi:hypothetical protein